MAVFKLHFLEKCGLILPSAVSFSHLTTLEFMNVELLSESEGKIFSRFPLLQNLTLQWCVFYGFNIIDISTSNLKRLKIIHDGDNGLCNSVLKVACPSLVSLYYYGPLPQNFLLQDLLTLDDAYVGLEVLNNVSDEEHGSKVCEILRGLQNAKSLKLDVVCLSNLYHTVANMGHCTCFSSFDNLKSLKFSIGLDECFFKAMLGLLKCCPHLDALAIEFQANGRELNDIKMPDEAIPCLTYHLKMVELRNCDCYENEIEVIRFLLKNGRVLEKLSVLWLIGLDDARETIERVMEFPRSSSNVTLTFLEPKSVEDSRIMEKAIDL
ncbi:uncharacterized protein LOC131167278 [Malania oleifera]|uniref:uncharacterized protein LOC131167278 n=1 Tax=Malania oleifera TaxID=397392 RepID=UPI0025AE0819|nr:uncharacterized protein LOC131167278 [Malania oleifera]